MKYIGSLVRTREESWGEWYSRLEYAVLRRVSARHREQYRLEGLIGPSNCLEALGRYQFNILTGNGLKAQHSILDIGCGPLTVGLRLIEYLEPGRYVGLDVREAPLGEAYRLISKHSLAAKNPVLVKSEGFGKEELGERAFDYIWMSQLSYHLDDDQMGRLFEQARVRSRNGSRFLFDIHHPEGKAAPGAQWSGFLFYIRPVSFFEELGKRLGFEMRERGRIEDYGYPKRIKGLKENILLEFRRI